MTIIKSQSQSSFIVRYFLFILVFLLIAAGVMLVFLYNRAVNWEQNVRAAAVETKRLQTENAELQDTLFSLFTDTRVETLAAGYGLVKDKSPRYLEVQHRWFLASQ
ncbi:MAG: hypothetical protein RL681_478 [Candidatus Parcubacteria bacterium]|jgi:cell division protein FtsL